MNVSFSGFEGQLNAILTDVRPENIDKQLAAFAKQTVAQLISSGQASREYDLYVNNRPATTEDVVKAPGPILYVFSNWRAVIEEALMALKSRVPQKSGRYAASFLVVVGGRVVTSYDAIPASAQVIILNSRPYTRKMETGGNKTGARHFENAKSAVNRRFAGAFMATTTFLKASGGLHPDIPYILRGSSSRRKDSKAGMPLTYPALILQAA